MNDEYNSSFTVLLKISKAIKIMSFPSYKLSVGYREIKNRLIIHPAPQATLPRGSGTRSYGFNFLFSIAEVFLHKIYHREKLSQGRHQSETFFLKRNFRYFRYKYKTTTYRNTTYVFLTKISWSDTCAFPSQHPQICHDLDSFF